MLFRSVASPVLPVGLGTASGLLRRPASAKLLLCSRTLSVLAPPFRSPRKQLLVWGAAPTRFPVPETNGQNRRNVCTSRITLIGFLGSDAERKSANATHIAIFSLATKTSWKNDAGS
jgi:hypothetical protein